MVSLSLDYHQIDGFYQTRALAELEIHAFLVGKFEGKSLIGRPRRRNNYIEIVLPKFDVYGFSLMRNCPLLGIVRTR
jgi:hypothetical protein